MNSTFRLRKKKNDYDEYIVEELVNGKFREDGSYYTEDWEDAVGTLKDMAKRAGLTVRPQGNGFIADSIKDNLLTINQYKEIAKLIDNAKSSREIQQILQNKLLDVSRDAYNKAYVMFDKYTGNLEKQKESILDRLLLFHTDRNFNDSIKDGRYYYEVLWYPNGEKGDYEAKTFSTPQAAINFYEKNKNTFDEQNVWITKRDEDGWVMKDYDTRSKRWIGDSVKDADMIYAEKMVKAMKASGLSKEDMIDILITSGLTEKQAKSLVGDSIKDMSKLINIVKLAKDSSVKDSKKLRWIANDEYSKEIQMLEKLGAAKGKLGGNTTYTADISVFSKVFGMSEQELINSTHQRMSALQIVDSINKDMAYRPFRFSVNLPALKRAIKNSDKAEIDEMIDVLYKDIEDYKNWKPHLTNADISYFNQEMNFIKNNLKNLGYNIPIYDSTKDAQSLKPQLESICKKYTSDFGIDVRRDLNKYEIKLGKDGAKFDEKIAREIDSTFGDQLRKVRVDRATPLNDIVVWIDVYPNFTVKDSKCKDAWIKLGKNTFASKQECEAIAKKYNLQFTYNNNSTACYHFKGDRQDLEKMLKNESNSNKIDYIVDSKCKDEFISNYKKFNIYWHNTLGGRIEANVFTKEDGFLINEEKRDFDDLNEVKRYIDKHFVNYIK